MGIRCDMTRPSVRGHVGRGNEKMAAIARGPRAGGIPWRWIAVGVAVVVIGLVGVALANGARAQGGRASVATVAVSRGNITAHVDGIGTVAAAQSLDLVFATTGTVREVLVHDGDAVTAGQPIARLDDRALQSQVANAQTSLESARAKLAQAQNGNAKPEDLAAARAQLASAQASYDKTAAGPTAADVANAEAALRSAEANLKDVAAGSKPSDVASAQASVKSAESQLAAAQKDLADLKAQPDPNDVQADQLALEQAKDALWSAQLSRDATCGQGKGGTCQSANANVAAQETAVNQAQVKLAKASEPAKAADLAAADEAVRSAESGLASAKANLAKVTSAPTAASLQSAQSQVDQAKASLLKVQTSVTANDVTVAKASVDQAKANLSKLTAPATDTDLAIQRASVDQAEQSLKQAQLNLDNATLTAPFAGVISAVNVVPGSSTSGGSSGSSSAGAGGAVVATLIDRGTLHVDLKLSENDVAKVAVGQPATLSSDSLPSWGAKGTVSYIAPASQTTNGVETYLTRVTFQGGDPALRVGMTTNVTITTGHQDNVLLVPSTALLPKGNGHVVQKLNAGGASTQDVDVQVGLTDGSMTEITSGLNAGDRIVALPTSTTIRPSGGLFGG